MPYVMEDLNSLEPLKPIAVSTETKLKIKDLFKDLHQDIGYKLKDAREKIKNAELKKEDAAVKLKSLQARAITAKPEEKQEIDKLLAEAQVLLQRAEDELAKAKQRESELLKEKERVENEIKNMETKMQAGGN
jgi:septal ring factor EnvC (AmiA/AmiB activator)